MRGVVLVRGQSRLLGPHWLFGKRWLFELFSSGLYHFRKPARAPVPSSNRRTCWTDIRRYGRRSPQAGENAMPEDTGEADAADEEEISLWRTTKRRGLNDGGILD